jgi:hypothetical protein
MNNLIKKFFFKINFYYFSAFLFFIFYYLVNYFSIHPDAFWIYGISLKSKFGQVIFKDYSFQHAPYINYFYDLIILIFKDTFNILLLLGYIQSIIAAYLSILICKELSIDEFTKKICFVVTLFSFNLGILFFFQDYYAFLVGFVGLYLIFIKRKFFLGAFFLSIVFFLKQTYSITFTFIFLLILFIELAFEKKDINEKLLKFCLKIFILILFISFHLLMIFIFSDFKKFYNEVFLFTFDYNKFFSRINIFDYISGIFFLLPNINNPFNYFKFFSFERISYFQTVFYILFRLPAFFFNFYLVYKIFNWNYKKFKLLLIFSLSTILPGPLLGRLYVDSIFFYPLFFYFFIFLFKNFKKNNIIKNNYKKILFIYSFLILLLLSVYTLKYRFNYFDFSKNSIIRSEKHLFLNIHKSPFARKAPNAIGDFDFDDFRDMNIYITSNSVYKIFVLGQNSMHLVHSTSQPILNQDLGVELSELDEKWKTKGFGYRNELFINRFILDLSTKDPEYILYQKKEFDYIFTKFKINPVKNYFLVYENKTFKLFKKKLANSHL